MVEKYLVSEERKENNNMEREHGTSYFWNRCLIWKFWNGGGRQNMWGGAVNVNCFLYDGSLCGSYLP